MRSDLVGIEDELVPLCEKKAKPWQRIAILLLTVRETQLFRPAFESFTAWLEHLSEKTGMNPSSAWRFLKAGAYYLKKTGKALADLEGIGASPKKLELVEKIEVQDAVLGQELFDMVMADDPKTTVSYLQDRWDELSIGMTESDMRALDMRPQAVSFLNTFDALSVQEQRLLFEELINAVVSKGTRDVFDRADTEFRTKSTAPGLSLIQGATSAGLAIPASSPSPALAVSP